MLALPLPLELAPSLGNPGSATELLTKDNDSPRQHSGNVRYSTHLERADLCSEITGTHLIYYRISHV